MQETKDAADIVLEIGAATATKNGETVSLSQPAQIINNMAMVPLRFVSDALGPGNYAIPMACLCGQVTALEPAAEMVKILEDKAKTEQVENIKFIQRTWQEVQVEEEGLSGQLDLVFASMSPGVQDAETLQKMVTASKRFCFLRGFSGQRWGPPHQDLWHGSSMKIWVAARGTSCIPSVSYTLRVTGQRSAFRLFLKFMRNRWKKQWRICVVFSGVTWISILKPGRSLKSTLERTPKTLFFIQSPSFATGGCCDSLDQLIKNKQYKIKNSIQK